MSCGAGATSRCAISPLAYRISSIGTRALFRYPASAADAAGLIMAFLRKKPETIGTKAPLPRFVEPALAIASRISLSCETS
jgi:hypothetical protein